MVLLLVYGERVHQLHLNRERYRHVLIDLGNQVSTIHDDEQLFTRVIDQLVHPLGGGLDPLKEFFLQRAEYPHRF